MFADRRVSRLGRSAAVALAAALTAGLLGACGPDSNTGSPTPSGAGTTTVGAGGPTPTAAVSYPDNANAYAQAAIQAWSGNDDTRLGQLNDSGDTLFTTLNAGNYNRAFALYQCTGAAGSSICVFFNQVGDEADVRLRNDLVGQPHAVVDGKFHPITFPTDQQAYGQEALDDWLGHNTAAVALLTGKSGDTAFDVVPASHRTESWTFDHSEGAMGHEYYFWHNAAGDNIGISFAHEGFVTIPPNRHGLIESVVFEPHQ